MGNKNNEMSIGSGRASCVEQIKDLRTDILSKLTPPTLEECIELMILAQATCRKAQLPMASILYNGEIDGEDIYSCYAVYPQECKLFLADDRVTAVAWAMAEGARQEDNFYEVIDSQAKLLEAFGVMPDKLA